MPTFYSIDDIKRAAENRGSKWFSRGAMRFFGSRVHDTVYQGPGGVFFVSSEQPPYGPRGYAVRRFDPDTGDISTVGKVCQYSSRSGAHGAARRMAATAPTP